MDNIKNDKYYVEKILTDVNYLIALTKRYSKDELEKNETILDSIFFRFIQIAENSAKLTKEFKLTYYQIAWSSINGLRNRIVHDYGHTDVTVILQTLEEDIPYLKEILEQYI